jgi:hypothetical protein
MSADTHEFKTGDAVAVRTLDTVRDYFYVLSGEVTDLNPPTIHIRNGWRWGVDSELGRDITDALDQSGRRTAVLADNQVTLADCQHDRDAGRCRCHFGTIQAIDAGAIVEPDRVLPDRRVIPEVKI